MNKFKYIVLLATMVTMFQYCSDSVSNSSASNDSVNVTGPASIDESLSNKGTATIAISAKDFSGDVNLSIDRSEIDTDYAADADIDVSLSESTVTLAANQTKDVTLNYTILAHAPSFTSTANGGKGDLIVVVTIPSKSQTLKVHIPFQVDPTYVVRISAVSKIGDAVPPNGGSGAHKWMTGLGTVPTTENFRHHAGNFIIRFINTDINIHEVHAQDGAILHEGGPLSVASSLGKDGGTYDAAVNQTAGSATYYCHIPTHDGADRSAYPHMKIIVQAN